MSAAALKPKPLSAKTVVHREVVPLGHGSMMQTDPLHSPLSDVVTSYAVINYLEKAIEKRKKALNPHLLAQAKTHGTELEKGHRLLMVGQEKVIRERALSSAPEEEKLKLLLETHHISLLEAFDEVKTVVLNPSKLKYLVEVGKLKAAEVDALREESFRLKVEAGPELKELLLFACGAAPAPEPEEEAPKKRNRR
jgi:hypothetical protein